MNIFLHISKSIIGYLLIGLLPVIFVTALFNTLIPVYILNIICPIISIFIFYNYYFKDLTSKEHGILSLLNLKNLSLKDIVKILLLAIFLIYSITFIAFISSKYFPNSYSSLESILSSMPSTIIYILCTCIIGPIYEEILFRGLIKRTHKTSNCYYYTSFNFWLIPWEPISINVYIHNRFSLCFNIFIY